MKRRVGTICYACDSGLGVLAKSFYDARVVTDVLVVRHAHHKTHDDWYPESLETPIRPFDSELARWFCKQMDTMLFFETPFDWSLIPYCCERKVRTVLMPMHECMPKEIPHRPDLWLCPSLLDLECYPDGTFLPVPVDVAWRQRTEARVFVHNAGHGGLKGRNGTAELIEAMRHVKSPLKLILRIQSDARFGMSVLNDPRVDIRVGTVPYGDLYAEGDVFVFPEKFNGLSLPLQEARAAGMLVMATDRFPMNRWLLTEPLIPTVGHRKASVGGPYREFDEAVVDPKDIAATMDAWYGRNIEVYSRGGLAWSAETSWGALRDKYRALLGMPA